MVGFNLSIVDSFYFGSVPILFDNFVSLVDVIGCFILRVGIIKPSEDPFFCLFSGSWPTVIAEALVLAIFIPCHPWYQAVFGDSRDGFVAAAAIVAAAGAVYYVLPDLFSHLPPLLSQNDQYLVLVDPSVDPDGA